MQIKDIYPLGYMCNLFVLKIKNVKHTGTKRSGLDSVNMLLQEAVEAKNVLYKELVVYIDKKNIHICDIIVEKNLDMIS